MLTAALWRPPCRSRPSNHPGATRYCISVVLHETCAFLTGGLSLCIGEDEEIEEREICLKGAPGDEGGEGGGEGMNFGTGFLWLIERPGST